MTSTQTWDERSYDLYVTVGRHFGERLVFETGYWLGLLELYLDEGFASDEAHSIRMTDWFDGDTFTGARAEGVGDRTQHTAEDLFVWAHDWMQDRTWPGSSH